MVKVTTTKRATCFATLLLSDVTRYAIQVLLQQIIRLPKVALIPTSDILNPSEIRQAPHERTCSMITND